MRCRCMLIYITLTKRKVMKTTEIIWNIFFSLKWSTSDPKIPEVLCQKFAILQKGGKRWTFDPVAGWGPGCGRNDKRWQILSDNWWEKGKY